MSPLILNIESATDICSVCLSKGKDLLFLKESEKAYSHASVITYLIETCFAETGHSLHQLDTVAVSKGPGSYTSLRVGASTAKGICYALDKPLIVIDTLKAIAQATFQREKLKALYAPMIDARRMEVYTALYDESMNTVKDLTAMIIDEFSFASYLKLGKSIVLSGNGAPKCNNALKSEKIIYSDIVCSALHLIPFSFNAFEKEDFSNIAYFSPTYFKSPNITIPRKIL